MIRNGDVFELNLTQQWRAPRPDQWCHLAPICTSETGESYDGRLLVR